MQFAKTLPFSSEQGQFARAARKLIADDYKDNRESGIRLLTALINVYFTAGGDQFVTDASDIVEKYKDESAIVIAASKLLDKLDPAAAARLLAKVGTSEHKIVNFHVRMFELRTKKIATLDGAWLDSLIKEALTARVGERTHVSIIEILDAVTALDSNSEPFWKLCSRFAKEAMQEKYVFEYRPAEFDGAASANTVALSTGRFSFLLSQSAYSRAASKVVSAFLERSKMLSEPNAEDMSVLGFWMLRLPNHKGDSPKANDFKSFFIGTPERPIKNGSGVVIAQSRGSDRVSIKVDLSGGGNFLVYWRDPLGTIQSAPAELLHGLEKDRLEFRTGIPAADSEDAI